GDHRRRAPQDLRSSIRRYVQYVTEELSEFSSTLPSRERRPYGRLCHEGALVCSRPSRRSTHRDRPPPKELRATTSRSSGADLRAGGQLGAGLRPSMSQACRPDGGSRRTAARLSAPVCLFRTVRDGLDRRDPPTCAGVAPMILRRAPPERSIRGQSWPA